MSSSTAKWIGVAIVAWVAWKGYRIIQGINVTRFQGVTGAGPVVPYPSGVGNGTTPPGATAGVDPSTGRPLF